MKLALLGGAPVRKDPFPAYCTMGEEEKAATARVIDSGVLSKFLGCWDPDFYGGAEVQALEREWAARFGARHAISVNSATSGLYAAVGAAGVEPGDEVIVSPYTMSASATAALVYGGVPVFADIEPDCFCLSAASVERRITKRTKAIIVVDIFGQPYDADGINALAREHGLKVIEDAAQAPGARHGSRWAGTLGDLGVFSLNYHKHIHSGEGGVVVTNDDALADRVRLIRNHAEVVVGDKGVTDLVNMVGFNYRMTELEASVARCQLRKLDGLLARRLAHCASVAAELGRIPAIVPAPVRGGCVHVFYMQPFRFLAEKAGVSRERFIEAVKAELKPTRGREAEGPLVGIGYVKPLYLEPIYQRRIAFGRGGWPFTLADPGVSYAQGLCPVAERMHFQELFSHDLMHASLSDADVADVAAAFHKVWECRSELA